MAAYTGFFFLVATWVAMDASGRGLRAWPYAMATLTIGWAGLGAYLAARHVAAHPERTGPATACVRAAAAQLDEVASQAEEAVAHAGEAVVHAGEAVVRAGGSHSAA